MKKPSVLRSIFGMKCPACREGEFFVSKNPYDFKQLGKYHKNCAVCGQRFSIEPGFYFGAAYVSYALNVTLFVACAIAVYVLVPESKPWHYVVTIVVATVVLAPIIFRYSRIIWATLFIPFGGENKQFDKNKEES